MLAAEVSLVDLAIQIIRSIQYEPVRNDAMRSINGRWLWLDLKQGVIVMDETCTGKSFSAKWHYSNPK